jgi:CheY-specific phosphatase CheX
MTETKNQQEASAPADEPTSREAMAEQAGEAIRQVIVKAFITMAGMDATVGPRDQPCSRNDPRHSVSGTIDWAGAWQGIGTLDCSPEFACYLANLMLETQSTTMTQDAIDAVAEMTNIIFGGMKRQLEPIFGRMELNIPSVAVDAAAGSMHQAPIYTVIPVQIAEHSLQLKLLITHVKEKLCSPCLEEQDLGAIAEI